MAGDKLLDRIDAYIIKGKLPQAIDLLIQVCQSNGSQNTNEVKLLSTMLKRLKTNL